MREESSKKKLPPQKQHNEKQPPKEKTRRRLSNFQDYIDLFEDVINEVYDGDMDSKKCNSICVAAGYALTALKSANAGKLKMNVFLQNVHNARLQVENMSAEQMDQFLQGSEDVQVEVLQQLAQAGGVQMTEVEVMPKSEVRAKLDVPLISQMTGIPPDKIRDSLSGEGEKPVMNIKQHEWMMDLTGTTKFCKHCCTEDTTGGAACPGDWVKGD